MIDKGVGKYNCSVSKQKEWEAKKERGILATRQDFTVTVGMGEKWEGGRLRRMLAAVLVLRQQNHLQKELERMKGLTPEQVSPVGRAYPGKGKAPGERFLFQGPMNQLWITAKQ